MELTFFQEHGITPITLLIAIMYLWNEVKNFKSKGKSDDIKQLDLEKKFESRNIGIDSKFDAMNAEFAKVSAKVNMVESDFNSFKTSVHDLKNTLGNFVTESRMEKKQDNKKMQIIFVGLQLICKEKGIDLKSFDIDSE
jgi:hypothetical protein